MAFQIRPNRKETENKTIRFPLPLIEQINKAKQEKKQLDITVDNIKYFLTGLRDGYVDTPKYRKTLINALVNRIYLYDDKMIVIINTQKESVDIDLTTLLNIESVLISQTMVHH